MKFAVIGSGISGLGAAHLLSEKYHVDLFEKEDHFGGHSYTYDILENETKDTISVDLGFIVFNKLNYPNLVKLFEKLQVPYEKSNMSFAVSVNKSTLEYSGSGLKGLFANKINIINLKFINMIMEIFYFYKNMNSISDKEYENKTLGEFLKLKKVSNYFISFHIIPMVAAIWSVPTKMAYQMPMSLFINFFKNHGLFKIKNRPQWYTVTGRSRNYVNKILKTISGAYFKNYKVTKVLRSKNGIRLYYGSSDEYFDYDHVVFAVHANEVLDLIDSPTNDEKKIFNDFKYKKNLAYLHSDDCLMPKNRSVWSSWNSILDKKDFEKNCVTYWLNKLQNLKTEKNYFLTLNPIIDIDDKKIIKKIEFTHPFYDIQTILAQKNLNKIQGANKTWFCGSYFGYGFHEDGLKSAISLVNKL